MIKILFTDGVVLIDPDYVKDRKVFGHVLAAFRYGREDLDVLGLTFRKDLYLAAEQIYPVVPGSQPPRELTRLQERLVKKLGNNAFPFYFELPPHCPASVTLQPAPGDTGKPCGVDYELKAFVGETQDDKPHKRYEKKKPKKLLENIICFNETMKIEPIYLRLLQKFYKTCNKKNNVRTVETG